MSNGIDNSDHCLRPGLAKCLGILQTQRTQLQGYHRNSFINKLRNSSLYVPKKKNITDKGPEKNPINYPFLSHVECPSAGTEARGNRKSSSRWMQTVLKCTFPRCFERSLSDTEFSNPPNKCLKIRPIISMRPNRCWAWNIIFRKTK